MAICHIMSSVNNDALGTFAGALLFYLVVRFLKEPSNLLSLFNCSCHSPAAIYKTNSASHQHGFAGCSGMEVVFGIFSKEMDILFNLVSFAMRRDSLFLISRNYSICSE